MLICADCGGACYIRRREEDDGVRSAYIYGSNCCFDEIVEILEGDTPEDLYEKMLTRSELEKIWKERNR